MVPPEVLVGRAQDLAVRFRAVQVETEAARRVPQQSFDALIDADLFRLLVPARHGGFEHDLETYLDVAFEVARGCGSTGWVYAITSAYQLLVGLYPEQAQDDVWGVDPRAVSAASFSPSGDAVPVDGGYLLSGKWLYCSGVDNCGWMILGVEVPAAGGEEPTGRGLILVPTSEFDIEDNWHVIGLAGTGSKNIACREVFVPAHRFLSLADAGSGRPPGSAVNPAALYRIPMFTVISISLCAAVMGMAQGAFDEFTGGIRERITRGASITSAVPMAELPGVQLRVGGAAAAIDAGRVLVRHDCREIVSTVAGGDSLSVEQRARFKRNQAFAVKLSIDAVDALFKGGGGGGLFTTSALQRYWRDATAGAMHITMQWDVMGALYGRVALGLPPGSDNF